MTKLIQQNEGQENEQSTTETYLYGIAEHPMRFTNDGLHTSVAFELGSDLQIVRQVTSSQKSLTVENLISEIGGLTFALFTIGTFLVSLCYSNHAQTHLVESLFAYNDKVDKYGKLVASESSDKLSKSRRKQEAKIFYRFKFSCLW
mmetsp:Transcript_5218/g.6959  ORF Transcript_5218/g.6959 Transcript_5218/m.6959 type:complete len:146 (+) Transcript_5218:339-776(+)